MADPVFTAEYDNNGAMKSKYSEIDGQVRSHFFKYDSDGRMTAVLDDLKIWGQRID